MKIKAVRVENGTPIIRVRVEKKDLAKLFVVVFVAKKAARKVGW